jgi:hydrogenase nickel incorporation protein HypA/HybF
VARLGRPEGRIEHVRVAVGELSAVEPLLLGYAWEAVTAGSPHAGARLEVEWCAARQVCDACRTVPERPGSSWHRLCPGCGHPLRVEGGRELDVLEMGYVPQGAPDGGTA